MRDGAEWHYMNVIRKMEFIVDRKQNNNNCFEFVYFRYTAICCIFSKDFHNVIKSVCFFFARNIMSSGQNLNFWHDQIGISLETI